MNVTLKVLKTGKVHLCSFAEIDLGDLAVERWTLPVLTQSRVCFLQKVDFAVLFGYNYVVSERGLSMGPEQDDVSKRNLDAQSLGNVEKRARGEECVVEGCKLVISRGDCFCEPVSGEIRKLD